MAVSVGANEYSFNWNNVPFGEHSLLAIATDNNGKQTLSNAANLVVNGSASVIIINPAPWSDFATSATINLTANASLSGGSINKVDFYVNGEPIGTGVLSGTNQYSLPWNATYSGSYFLVAVATDNSGITTTSKPVEIRVRENALPSVNITAPTNGSGYATPGNVVITANATDSDGAVTAVDFYANGNRIGGGSGSGTNQFSFTWSNPGAGSYSLTAIAVDDTNQSTTSSAVNISVSAPPTASVSSPATGTQYSAPAQVNITATASDSDGSVARTDFYANGSFIGTGTVSGTNQYSLNWANVGIGNYILTAVAIDNSGLSATSTGISVSVTSPVLFVANSTTLNSAENSVKARLEALNYTVVVKSAATAVTADATGKALVVISSTVTPSVVGTKFRTVTVPVVLWESGLFVNMGMTPSGNQNSGTTNNQTQLKIINASHPLAATLTGDVTVSASNAMSWGKPNANAISVATLVGDTTKSVIFGYQTGAVMPGLTAPARRVGVFMTDNTAASFTTNGGNMFDAAIKWAAGGAVITGSFASLAPSSVNLTQAGPMYWIHWGTVSATQFDRKNFNFQLISDYTKLGGSSVGRFNDNLVSYNWSDGQPTLSTAGTTTGIFVNDAIGNGFEITVPADTNLKTLKIYVGVWYAQGRLEASFTDGSAPVYVDTTIGTTPGRSNGVYSIQFKSAAPGQTLRIRYTIQTNHFSPFGNVTLESATLQ